MLSIIRTALAARAERAAAAAAAAEYAADMMALAELKRRCNERGRSGRVARRNYELLSQRLAKKHELSLGYILADVINY